MSGLATSKFKFTFFFFLAFRKHNSKYGRQLAEDRSTRPTESRCRKGAGVYVRARHGDVLALESECEVAGGLVLVPAMREKAISNGMFPFLFSSFAFAVRKAFSGWARLGCVHV